jgi:small subunit ribosomal protein S7
MMPKKVSRTIRTAQALKFIHCLMAGGERGRAERVFDAALETVRRRIRGAATPSEILNGAIENARPLVVVGRRRIGSKVYKVPFPVSPRRGRALAIRTIVEVARGLQGQGMASRLAKAILAAYRNELQEGSE